MSGSGKVSEGTLLLAWVLLAATQLCPRLRSHIAKIRAKMREAPGLPFLQRLNEARLAVREDSRRVGVARCYPPSAYEASGEAWMLEHAAYAGRTGFVDYTTGAEPSPYLRRGLASVTFLFTWIGCLFAGALLVNRTHPAYTVNVIVMGLLLLAPVPALVGAYAIGGFYGINPYDHGLALYWRRRRDQAEARLREALAERDDSLRARYALASLLLDTGRIDEAALQADELCKRYPGSAISNELLARVEAARGNADAADVALHAAAQSARSCGAHRFADLLLAKQEE